jgi:hypothetical protein
MDNYMCLQSSSGSSSGDAGELEETPSRQLSFSPLQSVVAFDGTVHGSFDAYIASLPPKNNQFISDKRFQGIVCILKGDTPEIDNAQLKRDREKLFNARELGPKARDQKTLFTLIARLETKTAREVSKHLCRRFAEHGVLQVLHTDNGGDFTGTVLVTELQRFFSSLRITTGASRKLWVQGCVEQTHNAVYSYLHHLKGIHGETFNWAELLPSVSYMHNTAVQTHRSESPIFSVMVVTTAL